MLNPRLILYPVAINLRASETKLGTVVKQLGLTLNSGDIFVFFNSKRDRCKVAWHDGRSFNTIEKLLQTGTFAPNEKIQIKFSVIEHFLDGGIQGQKELLHALHGNVVFIADARDRRK